MEEYALFECGLINERNSDYSLLYFSSMKPSVYI